MNAQIRIKKNQINVEPRTVYGQYGRGKRRVYDARGTIDGTEYRIDGAPSRAAAIEEAIAEVTYLRTAGSLRAHGCALEANGVENWVFSLRTNQPGRASAMIFGATDLKAAFERVLQDYGDHEDCIAFFAFFSQGSF